MTDAIHTIADYDDLRAVEEPDDRCRNHIATLLTEGASAVIWLPEWLVGEKDLTPAHAHPQLYLGEVYRYSKKALAVDQQGADTEFLPVSEAKAFRLADGVERIDTPQADLGAFGVES